MKYSIEDSLAQIETKKKRLIYRKKKRDVNILAGSLVLCFMVLAAAFEQLSGLSLVPDNYSKYGSFMLPQQAGGYVIVGVLCFAVAVVITLLCIKWKEKNDMKESMDDHRNEKEKNNI